MISCEEADELLAAYAMNRLDSAERESLREHTHSCRRHDVELAQFIALASALPLAVEEVAPPARLRSSILAAFDDEAAAQGAAPAAAPPPPRTESPVPAAHRPGLLQRLWRSPALAYGLAAALAIAVVGLVAWNLSLQSDDESLLVRTFDQGGLTMRVVYLEDEELAVIEVDMPALAANQTYQAWKIPESGAPVSLGLLDNEGTFAFKVSLEDATAIAISVEPAAGSPQPTTTPVIVQEL